MSPGARLTLTFDCIRCNISGMTLDQYLAKSNIRNAEFAAAVSASEATISRLRSGKQTPSYGLVRRIVAATNGAVTANDFMPDPAPAEAGSAA